MSGNNHKIIHVQFGSSGEGDGCRPDLQQCHREDWRRFYVIQLHIYLSGKRSGRIGTDAEGDMIRDLLSIYWEEIIASGILNNMNLLEKVSLFRSIQVDFPFIDAPTPEGFIPFEG
jgi:hypothetical protein